MAVSPCPAWCAADGARLDEAHEPLESSSRHGCVGARVRTPNTRGHVVRPWSGVSYHSSPCRGISHSGPKTSVKLLWPLFPMSSGLAIRRGLVFQKWMAAPRVLIYKELFPSISTFETPPKRVMASGTNDKTGLSSVKLEALPFPDAGSSMEVI